MVQSAEMLRVQSASQMEKYDSAMAVKRAVVLVRDGNIAAVQVFLSNEGFNIMQPDTLGMTLLHWACEAGRISMVYLLVDRMLTRRAAAFGGNVYEAFRDIMLPDSMRRTPLFYAVSRRNDDVVQLLRSLGAGEISQPPLPPQSALLALSSLPLHICHL